MTVKQPTYGPGATLTTNDPSVVSAIVAAELTPPLAVYGSNSYAYISTSTTTTVKSGAGTLIAIIINTKGASSNTATIYDNTSASSPVIGILDTTGAVGAIKYELAFSTGLTIVTATGTQADLTIVYR